MRHLLFMAALMMIGVAANAQNTYYELSDRAQKCIEADSLEQAENLLIEAMKLEPANPSNRLLFSNLGYVQRLRGEYDKAIDSYTYAVNLAPTYIPVLLDRAALYLETGQTSPALYDYNRVLDLEPDNEEALSMRAYIYMVKREYELARADYMHILKLKPDDYRTQIGLVTLEQKEMKFKDALERVNKLIAEHPDDSVLLTARADVEREMGHNELAIIDLDNAIALDANNIDAYLLRGDVYLIQGKKHLARTDYEKAISLGVPVSQMREKLANTK